MTSYGHDCYEKVNILTLKKAIDICRATKVSLEQAKSLTSTQEEMSPEINAVKRDQQNGPTK